ncbi:MAG: hypothetical protein P8M30_13455 [Planctomycetaceae bacterium]|nr:hypothetical protein [Planctomycetaceae bacterium]
MNSSHQTDALDSSVEQEQSDEEPRKSFGWGWLILAMGMYALVILSPKLAQQEILLADYQSLQQQMLADKTRLNRLHQVKQSIRSEPELVRQILNGQKSVLRGDREILPDAITPADQLGQQPYANAGLPRRHPHWYAPIVIFIGENETVRGLVLCGVIVLILITFVSVPPAASQAEETESDIEESETHPRTPNFLSQLKQRYGEQPLEDEINVDLELQLLELASEEDEWETDALPVDENEEEESSLNQV